MVVVAGQMSLRKRAKFEMGRSIRLSENWAVLSAEWFEQWKSYVGYDLPDDSSLEVNSEGGLDPQLRPGEINNSSIIADGTTDRLKFGIQENIDYVLIPERFYEDNFARVYKGGPQIYRSVINKGDTYRPIFQIELYPVFLNVFTHNADGKLNEQSRRLRGENSLKMRELMLHFKRFFFYLLIFS